MDHENRVIKSLGKQKYYTFGEKSVSGVQIYCFRYIETLS